MLLALAITAAPGAPAQVRADLSRAHKQLGGAMSLFAGTLIEGGGATGRNAYALRGVIEVSEEFPQQYAPRGIIAIGRQEVIFRVLPHSPGEESAEFLIPPNGTRIIAFGDPRKLPLVVYVNELFADTAVNRANIAAGPLPKQSSSSSGAGLLPIALFAASVGMAFASVFLAWFRVKYAVIGIAVSVALWLAYETQVPTQTNIRVDLVILFPFIIAAIISTMIAARDSGTG